VHAISFEGAAPLAMLLSFRVGNVEQLEGPITIRQFSATHILASMLAALTVEPWGQVTLSTALRVDAIELTWAEVGGVKWPQRVERV
jgi:ABC-type transporter Mla maintaining outer membrane lipid asymmetry permease subunit MlaE